MPVSTALGDLSSAICCSEIPQRPSRYYCRFKITREVAIVSACYSPLFNLFSVLMGNSGQNRLASRGTQTFKSFSLIFDAMLLGLQETPHFWDFWDNSDNSEISPKTLKGFEIFSNFSIIFRENFSKYWSKRILFSPTGLGESAHHTSNFQTVITINRAKTFVWLIA